MASPTYTSDQMDALARILAEAALNELINEISTREIIDEEQVAEMKKPLGHDSERPSTLNTTKSGTQRANGKPPTDVAATPSLR
jgi:intergrase/recombinase